MRLTSNRAGHWMRLLNKLASSAFQGNAMGALAAMVNAGLGKVVAVADWMPKVQNSQSEAHYQPFRARYPKPEDDYVHMRMQLMWRRRGSKRWHDAIHSGCVRDEKS